MKPDKSNQIKLNRALRDILLETTEEELRELVEDSNQDFEKMATMGQKAVNKVLLETENENDIQDLHKGLGALITMLRRRDKLSIDELAKKANVDPEEVRQIENESALTPNPRTIFQLENYFRLTSRSLVILSGAILVHSDVRKEAVRFAASSKNISTLNRDERKLLNQFVRLLQEHTDK